MTSGAGWGTKNMIMRSLQFSCIVAAVAFAYPFSERDPAALHLPETGVPGNRCGGNIQLLLAG